VAALTVKPSARQPVRLLGSGVEVYVHRLLGEGGQGVVFAVGEAHGNQFALKWYHRQFADRMQWNTLKALVRIGPPDNRFLWPIDLAVLPDFLMPARRGEAPGPFGYVMAIREPRFRELSEHLKRRVAPNFRELAAAGLQLADSFLQLHTKGLCYRDISYSNVFLDPLTGDVRICDNDNVGVDGDDSGIGGTPWFMAPEVVRQEAQPSTKTDRYSLAVLLFMMFMIHHPLIGARELTVPFLDEDHQRLLMGHEPVFIFDPQNESNRPVPGEHDNALIFWPVYPEFLRQLLTRSFTEGLTDPVHGRVTEAEWRGALARLRDLIAECPNCGQQNFYDVSRRAPWTCCRCGNGLAPPLRLVVGHADVVLDGGAKLYPHHLVPRLRYDYSTVLAEVTAHEVYDVLGLTNLSSEPWSYTPVEGHTGKVPPGATLRLAVGTTINFGAVSGEVKG
jgi:eukaryotic-like serine/threonine-protein kinase